MLALPIILLGLLSSASALVLPRHRALARAPTPVEIAPRAEASAPADWTSHNLEDYETYHIRYMALDCEDQHNSTFFTSCCHPRSASNTTAISAACTPSAKALASASAEYGPEDCEETSSVASATASATATAPATESTEECSEEETSTAKATSTPKATSTSKAAAATTSKAEASAAKGGAGALGQGAPTSSSSKAEATSSKVESSSKAESSSSKAESTSEAATTTKAASTSTKEATSTKTSSSAAATGSTFTGGVATYFTQNGVAGACGKTHSDSDFIAAIDQDRYGSSSSTSSLCGKQVKITNTSNKKTVTVTIADDCPTCKNSNSIDLSEGAFKQIATISEGEVDISWEFL